MSKTSSSDTTVPSTYENNPFFVATNGLDLLFKKALSIGILLAIISIVSTVSSFPTYFNKPAGEQDNEQLFGKNEQQFNDFFSTVTPEIWTTIILVGLIVLLVIFAVAIFVKGITDYTSARIAEGEAVTISEAFRGVTSNFWGYTWVVALVGIKVFLWTLLFIIPGIIMSIRYSLAGNVFFDSKNKLRGNAAIKESASLTKGAWLTTAASQNLFNLITFGYIASLLAPGTNAVLYRQLKTVGDAKPKAHILSWLSLIIPIVLITALVLVTVAFIYAAVNYEHAV